MHIQFTGPESKKSGVPFLLDKQMQPVTAANAWLRALSENGATSSPHTLRSYGYQLFDFFTFLEDRDIGWENITNDALLEYRDVQDQNPSRHTKVRLSRQTINGRLLTAGRFYEFAHEQGLTALNPIKYKEVKIYRPADVDFLAHTGSAQVRRVPLASFERLGLRGVKWRPHEEVMKWINSVEDWQDKLMARLLYRLGLRREEIVNLDINEIPDRSSVNPALIEVTFFVWGKGGKKRLVYISMRDFNEVHDYIEIVRARRTRHCSLRHEKVFVDSQGAPLKPASINRMFARMSERCGIHLTPHMMRHSFAVRALCFWKKIGVSHPEQLLQARLGHSSVSTTQVYMHLTDEAIAMEAFGNATLTEALMEGELRER